MALLPVQSCLGGGGTEYWQNSVFHSLPLQEYDNGAETLVSSLAMIGNDDEDIDIGMCH